MVELAIFSVGTLAPQSKIVVASVIYVLRGAPIAILTAIPTVEELAERSICWFLSLNTQTISVKAKMWFSKT